ncbi:hypothetical protein SKAU_G00346600 [Synaphobranchus kaupii]|uniref:Uncharacterized protein n=1 Tax=Synaphobranchus kaupii TaxID=118154 RepID=A0A9Q1EJN9_SYNKA|nr:hypothetical protein SKAU_G00346600 [Synaphobranchus kaupii]
MPTGRGRLKGTCVTWILGSPPTSPLSQLPLVPPLPRGVHLGPPVDRPRPAYRGDGPAQVLWGVRSRDLQQVKGRILEPRASWPLLP